MAANITHKPDTPGNVISKLFIRLLRHSVMHILTGSFYICELLMVPKLRTICHSCPITLFENRAYVSLP